MRLKSIGFTLVCSREFVNNILFSSSRWRAYYGALAEDTWCAFMTILGLDDKCFEDGSQGYMFRFLSSIGHTWVSMYVCILFYVLEWQTVYVLFS